MRQLTKREQTLLWLLAALLLCVLGNFLIVPAIRAVGEQSRKYGELETLRMENNAKIRNIPALEAKLKNIEPLKTDFFPDRAANTEIDNMLGNLCRDAGLSVKFLQIREEILLSNDGTLTDTYMKNAAVPDGDVIRIVPVKLTAEGSEEQVKRMIMNAGKISHLQISELEYARSKSGTTAALTFLLYFR